jgi:hypothetical protein
MHVSHAGRPYGLLLGFKLIFWRGRIQDYLDPSHAPYGQGRSPLRLLDGFSFGGLGRIGALKNLIRIASLKSFTAMLALDLRFGQVREFW